jgi:hypothetical protein
MWRGGGHGGCMLAVAAAMTPTSGCNQCGRQAVESSAVDDVTAAVSQARGGHTLYAEWLNLLAGPTGVWISVGKYAGASSAAKPLCVVFARPPCIVVLQRSKLLLPSRCCGARAPASARRGKLQQGRAALAALLRLPRATGPKRQNEPRQPSSRSTGAGWTTPQLACQVPSCAPYP